MDGGRLRERIFKGLQSPRVKRRKERAGGARPGNPRFHGGARRHAQSSGGQGGGARKGEEGAEE